MGPRLRGDDNGEGGEGGTHSAASRNATSSRPYTRASSIRTSAAIRALAPVLEHHLRLDVLLLRSVVERPDERRDSVRR